MQEPSGFFTRLYDFSFTEFITPKIIRILFGIGIIAAAIGAFVFIVWAFKFGGFLFGLLSIFLSPFVFVFYSILVRVSLEIAMILFRISDNLSLIVKDKQDQSESLYK